jgi:hypothetical protein
MPKNEFRTFGDHLQFYLSWSLRTRKVQGRKGVLSEAECDDLAKDTIDHLRSMGGGPVCRLLKLDEPLSNGSPAPSISTRPPKA